MCLSVKLILDGTNVRRPPAVTAVVPAAARELNWDLLAQRSAERQAGALRPVTGIDTKKLWRFRCDFRRHNEMSKEFFFGIDLSFGP